MKPWKKYIFECFDRNEFIDMPLEVQALEKGRAMWRFATWEAFRTDIMERNGPIAATTLSMLFKPKVIVEMGVHAGWTSLLLCRLNPDAIVHGVDISDVVNTAKDYPTGYVVLKHKCPNFKLYHMGVTKTIVIDKQFNYRLQYVGYDGYDPDVDLGPVNELGKLIEILLSEK